MGKTVLSLAVTCLLAAPLLAQGPLAVAPREGLLLLRNGSVLRGKIARDGDRYFVALPGGEVRVRADDVAALCDNLDDCYRHKQAQLRRGDIRDHLDLADWCVQHGLLGPAARELSAALEIDARHPRIALIERRIRLAQREPPPAPTPSTLPERHDDTAVERLVRSLPKRSVEHFTSTVHPILQNHCATSGCHSAPAGGDFRLLRLPRGRTASQHLTQRNLYAALQTVDRSAPADSRLLTVPLEAHGTAEGPIFTSRNAAAYRQLVTWVRSLTTRRGRSERTAPMPAPPSPGAPDTTKAGAHAAGPPVPAADAGAEPSEGEDAAPPVARSAQRDAFDPDIFNRRYFPDRAPH